MLGAALGHLLSLYFLWRLLGRNHGWAGIVLVVVIALVVTLGMRLIRGGRRRRY